MSIGQLKKIAIEIRKQILMMSFRAQSAHTGGALSCVEILVALYFRVMRVFPKDPSNDNRDRLIFSKAHDAKALYAVLSQRGFFDRRVLDGYEMDSGLLAGHSTRNVSFGIEASAGSLGHGLAMAAGVALAGKQRRKQWKVYAILSDGECDEGSTWEAVLFARQHKLDNLIAVVDYNKLQGFGYTKNVLDLEPFAEKWEAFGWEAREVDGHNFTQLVDAFTSVPFTKGNPSVIIAHTIKGRGGVAKHVNQISSQYKPPTEDEYKEVMEILDRGS